MNGRYEAAIIDAAFLTFKTLAATLPAERLSERPKWMRETCAAAVSFTGPLSGTLSITMYGNALAVVAGNTMESQGIPNWQAQKDVLAEISNVICGNMLPAIGGQQAVFNVGIPEVIEVMLRRDLVRDSARPTAQIFLQIADGCAEIKLFLNGVFRPS